MTQSIRPLFLLDTNVTYLNHGSFGACPKPIFNSLIKWQTKLENQPVQFLAEDSEELMYNSRKSLSSFIDCDPDDVVFFQNPMVFSKPYVFFQKRFFKIG